jgi:hypothetical protein
MDNLEFDFEDALTPPAQSALMTSSEFENGPKIDPISIIITYSGEQWEEFIEEWVHSLTSDYLRVMRPTGPGDKGLDIVGFVDSDELLGVWDNYQCKHYGKTLGFSDIAGEIGKILWYSFSGVYAAPRACKFVAPRGPSTRLALLMANAKNLRAKIVEDWNKSVATKITKAKKIDLTGEFIGYVEEFDFGIFSVTEPRAIIEAHRITPYHIGRFGGGLPPRPATKHPPESIAEQEHTYTKKLFDAYSEYTETDIQDEKSLSGHKDLKQHFSRSREAFYHAESLRLFVRDKTEPGTFASFQDEVFEGVVDTCDRLHSDGYARVTSVTDRAQSLSLDAHPLNKSAFAKDRKGICHQLANDGKLTWKK